MSDVTTRAAAPRLTKGQRTRQRIFDAAFELFGRLGYQAVSLRDIAAEVGITHVTVLHYFSSKDQLLLELMVHRDELEKEAARAFFAASHEADPRYRGLHAPALRWFMHRLEVNAEEDGAVPLFLKISTEATSPDHPAHAHFVDRYQAVLARIEEAFAEEFALRGESALPLTPRIAAEHLVAIADGLQFQSIYRRSPRIIVDDAWEYLRLLGITAE